MGPESGLGALLGQPVMGCLLLAAVTLLTYWPVQGCGYISLDDPLFLTGNYHLQAGLSLEGLLWALSSRLGALWHPVTWLTYLLDFELFGRDPAGPHIINLLWHVANAVLLFLVWRELTGAYWRSLVVAALFALHPLHVESVAWLSERKDVVSTCFGLLATWAYARYAAGGGQRTLNLEPRTSDLERQPSHLAPRTSHLAYGLSLLCFVLGLMSKPMLVTLPFVFLLLDFWPLERLWAAGKPRARALGPLLVEKLPFFLLSAIACWITLWAQAENGAIQPLAHMPLTARLGNALVSYARYAGHLFWPAGLALPYPAARGWPLATIAYAGALVTGMSAIALWLARRAPYVATGWFWYLGMLVPVIGLVQVGEQSMADRYMYLPAVGLLLALTWSAGELLDRRPGWRVPTTATAVAMLAACALLTRQQLGYWQNSETLFTHTLAVTQDNWMACFCLGTDLSAKGRKEEAIGLYRRALKVRPDSTQVLNNLGNALSDTGRHAAALQCFETALRLGPNDPSLHSNYGAALEQAGRRAESLQQYERALELAPGSALTHYRLANSLARLGRNAEAIAQYRLAVQYRPDYTQAYNNLGVVFFNQGKLPEAIAQFSQALSLDPADAQTRCNLGNALAAAQRWEEAAEQYSEAAKLQPDLASARRGLAQAMAHLGQPVGEGK